MLVLWSLAVTAVAQVPDSLAPPATAQVPLALIPPATNLLAHTLSAKDAGPAWEELTNASRQPDPPAEWRTKEPSEKEQADFFLPYVLALMDKSKDFYTRFPNDPHAGDARKQEFEITTVAIMNMGATNQQPRLEAEEKILLADPALSENERFEIREGDVERAAHAKESVSEAAALDEFEKGARALQKEFPKRPEIMKMLLEIAGSLEATKARAIFQEITNSPIAGDDAKETAAGELKKLDAIGKPIDLRFAAVDGRAVDVSKMKGKVVLVDFWATWCGPCVEEMPDVKAAYDKDHAKGFEIVGVSLDKEKQSLTAFVSAHKMEWPQYFESGGGDNKFAQQFEIDSIPTMWLIDKKGNLRDVNARTDLSGKVEKLLAE
jgi:thiol-disulfide isomerase/thioredoxin